MPTFEKPHSRGREKRPAAARRACTIGPANCVENYDSIYEFASDPGYIDEPVIRVEPAANETLYFHRNQQYSVTALTSSTGAVVERYAYTAYGEPKFLSGTGTVLTDSAKDNRYTYTGREWDKVIGLYHFRARMYDVESGRFCGRDPIGYAGSPGNLFVVFGGQMTSFVDPSGTSITSIPCGPRQRRYCENDCSLQGKVAFGCICSHHVFGKHKFTSAIPRCRDKPKVCGRCTPQELAWLQGAKDVVCVGTARPRPNQSCTQLRFLAISNAACAAARQAIQTKCFPGQTDKVHQDLIDEHTKRSTDAWTYYWNHVPPCGNPPEFPFGQGGPMLT